MTFVTITQNVVKDDELESNVPEMTEPLPPVPHSINS